MARILVIEDNPASLELMTYLLEAFGHVPAGAVDGAAGLAAARHERPDAIVCDVQLPEMDGYEVARQLKADPATRPIPLVAVTALAMVGDREQVLAAGFDGYISKPIVPELFVSQVEAFLAPGQGGASAPVVAPGAEPAPAGPAPATRATILVVDDSPVNRELMCSMLEPFGYVVIAAGSVRAAIDLARAHLPQLVVSDLHMPDQNGFDLIRALKADPQLSRIDIVIHSATVKSEQDRRDALRLGARKFLTRPLEPQFILAEIQSCLEELPERQDGEHIDR